MGKMHGTQCIISRQLREDTKSYIKETEKSNFLITIIYNKYSLGFEMDLKLRWRFD